MVLAAGGKISHHFMGAYLKSLVAVMGSQFGSKQLAGGCHGCEPFASEQ